MMVALRLEPCTMRAGTNIARPDDRTIDEGRASVNKRVGISLG